MPLQETHGKPCRKHGRTQWLLLGRRSVGEKGRSPDTPWTCQNPSASGKGITKPYPTVSSLGSDIASRSVR